MFGERIFSFMLDHTRQQMVHVIIKFIFDSVLLFANINIIFVKWFTIMLIFLLLYFKTCKVHDATHAEQQFFLCFHWYNLCSIFFFSSSYQGIGEQKFQEITLCR